MIEHIRAIYENGVLRPLQPLDLPEGSIVWIKIIEILGDGADFMTGIEKHLSKLEITERERLKKID